MMSIADIMAEILRAVIHLEAEGQQLRVRALLEEKPLTEDVLALCRKHKSILLAYLEFSRQADSLLLDSTRRLAKAWPPGCQLDLDERWKRAEGELHDAYWGLDLDRLKNVIENREATAFEVFAAFLKERPT